MATQEEITAACQQMLYPLRVFEAETTATIMEYRARDEEVPRRFYEALNANRDEMDRVIAYFAKMAALIHDPNYMIVGSDDDMALHAKHLASLSDTEREDGK